MKDQAIISLLSQKMDYQSTLCKLFHLVICADGVVSESEINVGKQIMKIEGLDESAMETELLNNQPYIKEELRRECIDGIRLLSRDKQLRCMAWMCVIADIDWIVNKDEWDLIHDLYSTTLKLPLSEIVSLQCELNKKISFIESL